MKKPLKRRDFLGRASLAALATATLGACTGEENTSENASKDASASRAMAEDKFSEELEKNRQMPRDLVMKMLDQKADQYMQLSHHCAQSSFLALKEQFGLNGEHVVKALTPMPGIAERGETCGAVTGPLMALGLIYGRDLHHLDDWDTYQESLVPTGHFCELFEKEFGTTLCHKVQEGKFGRFYRLTDPGELQEFQNEGATEKCSEVVRAAVHMAAEIILDDTGIS
jgi:C_GCAxxG_C_C family probable redox protein